MKNTITALILIFSIIGLISCSKEETQEPDPNTPVADPTGTVIISILAGDNGNNFQGVFITSAGNLAGQSYTFNSIGKISGLGNITTIPKSGYATQFLARAGYGYIGKQTLFGTNYVETKYIRFWIEAVSANSADIRYQFPFLGNASGIETTNSDTIIFPCQSDTAIDITFKTAIPFNASLPSNSWAFIHESEKGAFSITVMPNTNAESRTMSLKINSGSVYQKTITILQRGVAPFITASPKIINADALSSQNTITINSNSSWKVSSNESWCKVLTPQGVSNGEIKLRLESNYSGLKRTATITIQTESGEAKEEVTVNQDLFFSAGAGIEGDPYIIESAEQLDLIRKYPGSYFNYTYFRLNNDIDLTDFLSNSTEGWEPIGSESAPSYIVLDGNEKLVSGLRIDRPNTKDVGFIGYGGGIKVSNLTISLGTTGIIGGENTGTIAGRIINGPIRSINNCSVTGKVIGSSNTGGIVGNVINGIEITNCSFDGSISAGIIIGGIAGNGYATVIGCSFDGNIKGINCSGITNFGNVDRCKTTGNIEGTITAAGISTAVNGQNIFISNSYSKCNIKVTGGISNCFAGGIVANNIYSTITNSYFAGTVSLSFSPGGSGSVCGICKQGNVTNSFYDKDIIDNSSITDITHGRSTYLMQQRATYVEWDFITIWDMNQGEYPFLRESK